MDILSDYNRYSSVNNMLTQLQWPSLEKRQSDSHLCMFYRILHDPDMPIEIPHYIISTQYPTRNDHPYLYILPHASSIYYYQSFFPQTVKEWINLSLSVINSGSLLTFSLSQTIILINLL